MSIDDVTLLDTHLRERLTFFQEQQRKHGSCRDVLRALEGKYVRDVIYKYRDSQRYVEEARAFRWFAEYNGWVKPQ